MADTFAACLAYVLGDNEKGYWDDPRGGPTNLGVTQRTLSEWLQRPATVQEVQDLTPATVAPIYLGKYWTPARCDLVAQFAPGAELMMFDAAVNQGVSGAIKILQTVLGVRTDGAFGGGTAIALKGYAHTHGPGALITALQAARAAAYRDDAGFEADGKGWLARDERTAARAQQLAVSAAAA